MMVKVNIANLRRELALKGLRPSDLDKKGKATEGWGASLLFRLQKKPVIRPSTLLKLAKAIGCSPDAIAIYEEPVNGHSPAPARKSKANGKRATVILKT